MDVLRDLERWRKTVGPAVPEEPNPRYDIQVEADGFDWP